MDSALGPQGVFYMFALFMLAAVPFVYFFMGETRGLSERERKQMFCPGEAWGRKLRPGEKAANITPIASEKRMPKAIGDSYASTV